MSDLEAMQPRPSQYNPGHEIPEKSWFYRFAKKHWFYDFGVYSRPRRRNVPSPRSLRSRPSPARGLR